MSGTGRRRARVRFHPTGGGVHGVTALHAERLYGVLGHELPCMDLARLLRAYVQSLGAPVVGAMRVGCSDEAEQEAIEAFQRGFVRYLLPSLKFSTKSPFRSANLGGRYEWGAARIAEDHYALARGAEDWKVMVLKINSHVSVDVDASGAPRFGVAGRYGADSTYCGALAAVLGGVTLPFARGLAEELDFEGVPRVEVLRDPARVDPAQRSLMAAALNARLQARRAMLDIQDAEPRSPTLWLVVPCVTLNRPHHDTEIPVGLYTADRRGERPHDEYCGLSDRPEDYRLTLEGAELRLSDPHVARPRLARDHRSLVQEAWRSRAQPGDGGEGHGRARVAAGDAVQSSAAQPMAKAALGTLLGVLVASSPVPAAVVLFGEGLLGIHHAQRAHRLAREASDDEVARAMLEEFAGRIDDLSPEEAQHLVHLLATEYGG